MPPKRPASLFGSVDENAPPSCINQRSLACQFMNKENPMRLAIITALSALATLAMVSGASAQNDQRVSDQSHVRAIHAPTVGDENGADADAYSADASGPTMEQ